MLTENERNDNCFAMLPRFHRRCSFDGGKHCSRYVAGTRDLNCYKYRHHVKKAYTRSLCVYARCPNPNEHHVVVCEALHSKCEVCGCRGHSRRDLCNPADSGIMAALRHDFEMAADYGIYTQDREEKPEWGFYPLDSSCFYNNNKPVDYLELASLPVLEAIAVVRSLSVTAHAAGAPMVSGSCQYKGGPSAKKRRC